MRSGPRWYFALRMSRLHPEHPEPRPSYRRVQRRRERQRQHAPRLARQNNTVVPQARGGVIRIAFVFVLLTDRRLEGVLVGGRPGLAVGLDVVALDGCQ